MFLKGVGSFPFMPVLSSGLNQLQYTTKKETYVATKLTGRGWKYSMFSSTICCFFLSVPQQIFRSTVAKTPSQLWCIVTSSLQGRVRKHGTERLKTSVCPITSPSTRTLINHVFKESSQVRQCEKFEDFNRSQKSQKIRQKYSIKPGSAYACISMSLELNTIILASARLVGKGDRTLMRRQHLRPYAHCGRTGRRHNTYQPSVGLTSDPVITLARWEKEAVQYAGANDTFAPILSDIGKNKKQGKQTVTV